MDIVDPLPRSRSGYRHVLMMCDYAIRYPEAIQLKTIDAEHIAEKMIEIFARVGVPREILTEEGSNFVSQLLAVLEQATSSEAYPDQSIPSTNGWTGRAF